MTSMELKTDGSSNIMPGPWVQSPTPKWGKKQKNAVHGKVLKK